jgi:hypothetical protein
LTGQRHPAAAGPESNGYAWSENHGKNSENYRKNTTPLQGRGPQMAFIFDAPYKCSTARPPSSTQVLAKAVYRNFSQNSSKSKTKV